MHAAQVTEAWVCLCARLCANAVLTQSEAPNTWESTSTHPPREQSLRAFIPSPGGTKRVTWSMTFVNLQSNFRRQTHLLFFLWLEKTSSSSCIDWLGETLFLKKKIIYSLRILYSMFFIIFSHPPSPFRFHLQTSYYFSLIKNSNKQNRKKQRSPKNAWSPVNAHKACAGSSW